MLFFIVFLCSLQIFGSISPSSCFMSSSCSGLTSVVASSTSFSRFFTSSTFSLSLACSGSCSTSMSAFSDLGVMFVKNNLAIVPKRICIWGCRILKHHRQGGLGEWLQIFSLLPISFLILSTMFILFFCVFVPYSKIFYFIYFWLSWFCFSTVFLIEIFITNCTSFPSRP